MSDRCRANCQWVVTLLAALLAVGSDRMLLQAADLREATELFRTGKYAECVDLSGKAIEDGEYSESWRLYKLKSEMALGRYADALKTLDAALERYPYSIELRWLGRDVCRYNNDVERAKKLIDEIVELARQSSWRFRDATNQIVLGRVYLSEGFDPKKILAAYTDIKRQQPNFVEAYLASGELALAKHDYQLAAEAYQQAVKLDAGNADAHFGLSQSFSPSDSEKAEAELQAALSINPNHVDSLLLVVDGHIDSENYDDAVELLDRIEKTNPVHPLAWAYRAVLAHLDSDAEKEKQCRATALSGWPTNPEVDHLIGRKLSQKYRFAEGSQYQRQSLQFDSEYLPAKMQLASDLLRLGKEEEGWRLANEVYGQDGYNVVAYNLVTLQDHVTKFRTLSADGFLLRMEPREADIYGQRVLDLLVRAKDVLCAKYDVTLDQPVIVEMFPRQQDFAIRTFGLPGGSGFLGVCFGHVITAPSPASQGASPSNWEATLWHEFCHVVTLNKTNNKMPRWLSEGISVYEERQADPTWGQSMNPRYREMILGDELTPVGELSGAFLHPPSPMHLQFAYFESALVVQFLIDKYGIETLQRVLVDLGVGMPINDSLARYAGSLDALNQEFAEFARKQAKAMAPDADWSTPDLPPIVDSAKLAQELEKAPTSYVVLQRLARQLIAEKKWQAAQEPLKKMIELFPAYAGAGNPYSMLATVYRELGETQQERSVLESLAALSADDVDALARLTELGMQAEDWPLTLKYATRLLAVNPLQRLPHRSIAAAASHTGNDVLAIEAHRALLQLDPIDPADLHFQLATLLHRTGDLESAKRHALLALEEAPRFRDAHRKLLEIVRQIDAKAKSDRAAESPLTESEEQL